MTSEKTSPAFWPTKAIRGASENDASRAQLTERIKSYLNPDDTVLELGGGQSNLAKEFASHVSTYICADHDAAVVATGQTWAAQYPNVTCIQITSGTQDLPHELDALIAVDLLHLLDDMAHALQRMRGMLRPGGHLLIRVATVDGSGHALRLPDLLRRLFGRPPAMSLVSPVALERMVRLAGFEIVSCDMLPRGSNMCMVAARAK